MRGVCFIISFWAISVFTLFSQYKRGDIELGMSGSGGSITSTSSSTNGNVSEENSESKSYAEISIIPGYYFSDGLSIEPELGFYFYEGAAPSIFLLGNLSYTLPSYGTRVASYAKLGYGLANSLMHPINIGGLFKVSNNLDVSVLNFGIGIKFLVTSSVELKTELNYRRYSYSTNFNFNGFSSKTDYKYSSLIVLFGFAVLF